MLRCRIISANRMMMIPCISSVTYVKYDETYFRFNPRVMAERASRKKIIALRRAMMYNVSV